MTAQEYRQAGFDMSLHESQGKIDAAERDAIAAYISPIIPQADDKLADDADLRLAVMNLAFLIILQRNVFVTRSGAKEKTTAESVTPYDWAAHSQLATTCDLHLREVAVKNGVTDWRCKINDICGIYFTTNYFGR